MNQKRRFVVGVCVGLAGMLASCGGDDGVHHLADARPGPDAPGGMAMLTIDRGTASFGSISIGSTSSPTTFTITNAGDAPSGVLAAALSGPDAASYALSANTCTSMLSPGATCTVAVTFAPMSLGTKTATFAVAATPGGMVTAALDGDGTGMGALMLTSTQSSLGSVVVGQTGTVVSTFTATNTGTAPTGALSVIPAGSDAADFAKSMDMCSGATLQPGASCTFEVRHAPQTSGAKGALYQVIGTPGGNVSGAVMGTALAPAALRAVPLQLDLGSVAVGAASPSITVTIANLGDETTGMLTQTVTGAGFSATASTCSGMTLAGHTTCTVAISLSPTTAGAKTGTLTITGGPGGTAVTTLVGTGVAASGLAITPSAKQFATTNVGALSTAQQFTIKNNGSAATGALAATLGDSGASQFEIVAGGDTCTGTTLAPAATCTVSVLFTPTVAGVAHGALTVAGSPGGSVSAGLLGIGAGAPVLSITPSARGFGSVTVGSMSPALTFTVTNLGGQVSGVPAATLTGAGSAQFALAGNTCTATLAPGASCTVQVRFAPTAAGAASASLSVTATPGGTVTSALTGDGAAAGGIVILPSNTMLPVTAVGDTSAAQTLTVLNTGSTTTSAISVSSGGGEFASTSACATLAPGATCTISVTFAPSATGARTGTITAMAATGGTATAGVAGQGIPRLEIIALESGPVVDPADFGTSIVNNTTPDDMHILVRNNTSTAKTFGVTPSFGSPAQYTVVSNTCSTTIAGAGGLCTVAVRFAPTTAGTKAGSITFDIGAGATNRAVQNLTGVATEALRITALDGTDFGTLPVNTTAPSPLRFRVTNPAGSQTSGTIAMALAGGAAFSIATDGCTGQTLAAGASCVVAVTFAPTTVATAMTTLTATASPGGMPFIDITGVSVAPTGNPPTDLSLSPSSIAEDAPVGSTVGTLSTTDPDAGNTFTYALVGGTGSTDNAAFTISGATVKTAGVLDFEIKSTYSIRVRVTDSGGNIFEKPLIITVTNVDELPVAVNDTKTVTEDDPATAIDVLANDTDPDGGPKLVASVTQPAHGTVVITGGGSGVTYQPMANYAGPDSFTYTLNGGSLGTVAVTVTPVDDPPVAVADNVTVAEDSTANALAVLANDTDIDAGPKSIASVTQPMHGTVAITGGGTGVTYTPVANYNGADSFSYTLNGGSTAVVTVTVTPVDDPAVAVDDSYTLAEDAPPALLDVVANDSDPDGTAVTIMSYTQPMHGTLTVQGSGLLYTVAPDYNGPDSFTYMLTGGGVGTVTLTVQSVNDVPSFTKGADQTVLEDAAAQSVAGWATMLSKGPANESTQVLDFVVTNSNNALFSTQPAVAANGTLSYTVAPNANGSATVTVRIHDNGGTANGGVDTSAAQTFTITVTAVNDAPSFTKGADQTVAEDAPAQSVANWATAISAGAANESSQTLTFTVSAIPSTLFSVQPAISSMGTLTYTLAANASGTASVSVTLGDNGGTANGGSNTSGTQTFTITVNPVNDAPSFTKGADQTVLEDAGAQSVSGWATAISAGPANEAGQTLAFNVSATNSTMFSVQPAISSTGTLTYTPAANANGTSTVTVSLSDNGGTANGGSDTSASTTFTITVTAVNDAPSFTKGADQSVLEDAGAQTVTGWATAISAGPANEAGQTLGFTVTNTGSALFSVQPAISSAGTLTYTPAANQNGSATVSVTLKDNGGVLNGGSDSSATVTFVIAIRSVNDAPTANPDTVGPINEDSGAFAIAPAQLTGNDSPGPSDEAGQTLSVTAVTAGTGGTVSISPASGQIVFTPNANFNGTATFTYTVTDNGTSNGASDPKSATGTVSIMVVAVDDAPVADPLSVSIPEDTSTQVTLSYSDVENDPATACSVGSLSNLNLTVGCACAAGMCRVSVQGTANYNGAASFTYTVTGNGKTSNSATASVTVTPVNDAPTASTGSVTLNEDTSVAITLSGDDIDQNSLAFVIASQPANGTLSAIGTVNCNLTPATLCTAPVTYTPNADYFGSDSFSFTVTDGVAQSTATVSITVRPVNDTPFANGEDSIGDEDTKQIIDVLANDTGLGDAPITITPGQVPAGHSLVVDSATNRLIYNPPLNYNGSISYDYQIRDVDGQTSSARGIITVRPVDDRPVAVDDSGTTSINKPLSIPVLRNDYDPDGDAVVIDVFSQPANGTVTFNPQTPSALIYTPNQGFCDQVNGDAFKYRVKDVVNGVPSNSATVKIVFIGCQ